MRAHTFRPDLRAYSSGLRRLSAHTCRRGLCNMSEGKSEVGTGRKTTLEWVEPATLKTGTDEKDTAYDELQRQIQNFRISAEVKDRSYFLKSYPHTFVGKETVTALINNGFCTTREEAVAYGNRLFDKGLFVNTGSGAFKDEGDYYRFTTSESLLQIGPNFWNIRGKFVIKKAGVALADFGTHMSIIRLPSGKFLVLDAIELSAAQKKEIDTLTDDGKHIEAVIGLHPFHTLWLPAFHKLYPSASYYGCPRHLKMLTTIPWSGSLLDEVVRNKWAPHISMKIPDGLEFVNPQPPSTNHSSSVLLLHHESGTLHVDDTFMYITNPGRLLRLAGIVPGQLQFHVGLKKYMVSPSAFHAWMHTLLKEWEFDNICTAHMGNKIGGAKIMLTNLLDGHEAWLKEQANKKGEAIVEPKGEEEINCNAEGDECG